MVKKKYVPAPTPIETVPSIISKVERNVLGYTVYYYQGDKSSYNSMLLNNGVIGEIATATHVVDSVGNLTGLIPVEQITLAHSQQMTPYLMIGNSFKGDVAKALLESSIYRKNLITNILNIMKANGYSGVNIDLEGVYSINREHYTLFMKELCAQIKPLGYIVSCAVPAKTVDNPNYTWNYAFDYASLGQIVDFIVLMTYDEHYPGGTAGAVASIGWVQQVLNYAVSVISKNKIYVGFASYGYDWGEGLPTKAYSINGCYNLASANSKTVMWDEVSKTPYFNYVDINGVVHNVWFENAQSIKYKVDLVNKMDLEGVAIWRLGLENSDYRNIIKSDL